MSSVFVENLVLLSQQGDSQAFGELYEIYSKDMYRFAWYYTGNKYSAEEAVSEAALSAFENIRSLKKPSSFKTWLFKILYNECKKMQKGRIISASFTDYSEETAKEYITEDADEVITLRNALGRLSDEEREILILYYSCGYSSKEISAITGIRATTLRSKISRATEKLRKLLTM